MEEERHYRKEKGVSDAMWIRDFVAVWEVEREGHLDWGQQAQGEKQYKAKFSGKYTYLQSECLQWVGLT